MGCLPAIGGDADAADVRIGQGCDVDAKAGLVGAVGERNAELVFQQGVILSPLYQREELACGNQISGPALVIQMDATTVVAPGWEGSVDPFGNLILEPT